MFAPAANPISITSLYRSLGFTERRVEMHLNWEYESLLVLSLTGADLTKTEPLTK